MTDKVTEKVKITPDRIISRGKGVNFYDIDGSIKTLPAKQVQIVEPGEDVPAVEDSRVNFEAEDDATAKAKGVGAEQGSGAELRNDAQGADSAPAATPASSTKRGKGKGKEQMATKKKAGKKKAASKSGNGTLTRMVAGREHDISGYEKSKSASGHTSYDNGDKVATQLRGKTLDEVYALASKKLDESEKDLRARYKKLNVGMQRMSLGNRLRKVLQPKAA